MSERPLSSAATGDLADVYQVATGNLNLAVRRNASRFPEDFMFQLTREEFENLRLQFATSSSGYGGRRYLPYAFTEHGVAIRAFVQTPRTAGHSPRAGPPIGQIEAAQKQQARTQQQQHTSILVSVVEDIQKLKNPPLTRAIGFVAHSLKKK